MVADEDAAQRLDVGFRKFLSVKRSSKRIAQLNAEDDEDKKHIAIVCEAVKKAAKMKYSGSLHPPLRTNHF